MSYSGWAHFDFDQIIKVRDKAVLVEFSEWDGPVWVPLSLVSEPDSLEEGQRDGVISIKEWWAEQNGYV